MEVVFPLKSEKGEDEGDGTGTGEGGDGATEGKRGNCRSDGVKVWEKVRTCWACNQTNGIWSERCERTVYEVDEEGEMDIWGCEMELDGSAVVEWVEVVV